jgi:hypothetical protein
MPPRLDRFVFFPEFNGPFRVTFQVHIGRVSFQAVQGEHFVHHLEDQHILPEWEAFGDAGFGKAAVTDLPDDYFTVNSPEKIRKSLMLNRWRQ